MMMTRNTLALLSCMLTLHVGESYSYDGEWWKDVRNKKSVTLLEGHIVRYYKRYSHKRDVGMWGKIYRTQPFDEAALKEAQRKTTKVLIIPLIKAGDFAVLSKMNVKEKDAKLIQIRNIEDYALTCENFFCQNEQCETMKQALKREREQWEANQVTKLDAAGAELGEIVSPEQDDRDEERAGDTRAPEQNKPVLGVRVSGSIAGQMADSFGGAKLGQAVYQELASKLGSASRAPGTNDIQLASVTASKLDAAPRDGKSGDFEDVDLTDGPESQSPEAKATNLEDNTVKTVESGGGAEVTRRRLAGRRRLANMRRRRRTLMDRLHRGNVPVRN